MTNSPENDDIIKNPNRASEFEQVAYVPEYKRLNINPVMQEFSSLDGEVVDPAQFTTNNVEAHILDNNEHVNYGFENAPAFTPKAATKTANGSPLVGEFVLMVLGKVIAHGNEEYILSVAKSILYKEHPEFTVKTTRIEDITILKRVGLKIGVFIDG